VGEGDLRGGGAVAVELGGARCSWSRRCARRRGKSATAGGRAHEIRRNEVHRPNASPGGVDGLDAHEDSTSSLDATSTFFSFFPQ
jgi:hypothetical protein